MPAVTPFAKLLVVLILAALDVANYIWGVDLYGLRNEQVLGVVVTLLLAVAGMIVPVAAVRVRAFRMP
jgi:hypothetical protein